MKIEYVSRKSRRIIAAALAMLMSVSIFAQTLPRFSAEDGVSGSDIAAAAEDAEVVTVEIPAEETEAQAQIDETVSIVKETSPSDAAIPDIDVPAPAAAVSETDAAPAAAVSETDAVSAASGTDAAVSAVDISADEASESDLTLSPEFSAERKINGWTVSVYAPEGVIPENAELRITNVNGALRDKAEAVADVEFDILVDVTIFADGKEIQPDTENGLVRVSLTKDGAVSGAFEMYHFNEAVTDVEILDTEIDGDTATAEVEHFSLIGGDDSIKTWTAFAAAVASAKNDDVIKLDGDIVRDTGATALTLSVRIDIDLNGHTISSTESAKRNGNLFTVAAIGIDVYNGTIKGFKNKGRGGAVYATGTGAGITFTNVKFTGCSTEDDGIVYGDGGAVCSDDGASISLEKNTTITGCSASDGGGAAALEGGKLTLLSATVTGNTADYWGGGVYIDSGYMTVGESTRILGNTANDNPSDNPKLCNDCFIGDNQNKGQFPISLGGGEHEPADMLIKIGRTAFVGSTDAAVRSRQIIGNAGYETQKFFVSNDAVFTVKSVNCTNHIELQFYTARQNVKLSPDMTDGIVQASKWSVDDGEDKDITLSIIPDKGYELDELSITYSATSTTPQDVEYTEDNGKYVFTVPDYDKDRTDNDVVILPTFKLAEYSVAADSSMQNGSVTPGVTKAKMGDTVSLTVTPATNYALDTLYYKVAGDTTEYPIDGTSFTMPAGNVTVYATFKQDHVHDLQYFGGALSNTIKAFCKSEDCPLEWDMYDLPTLTVTAPDAEYTALPYAGLSIDDKLTSVINDTYSVHYAGVSGTTYDSADAPTEIGSYKVKVSLDKANKASATAVASFKITKPSQTITFTPNVTEIEMTVGDTDKKLTYALTEGDGKLTCSIAPGTGLDMKPDGTLVATVGGSAGSPVEYTIAVNASETDAYKSTTATVKVKVFKKTQTISGDTEISDFAVGSDPIALSSKNVKTNAEGNTLTYEITEGDDCITVDNSGTVTAVKPGTAKIKVSAAAYVDYDAAEDLVITVTVIKGTQTISGSETKTVYYGGDLTDPTKPIKLDAALEKTDAEGKLSYVSGATDVCTVADDGTLTIKKPGTAKITVSAAATTLYNAPANKEITVTVAKRPLTITVNSKSAKVGEAVPAFDYVTPTLVGSDTLPTVTLTCPDAPVTDSKLTTAGDYDIIGSITDESFLKLYDVTFTEAKLAVTKHDHVWQYELNDACDTALAYCTKTEDKCDHYGKENALKFTLKIPAVHTGASSLVYDGEAFPVVYDGEDNAKFIAECGLDPIDPAFDITYICGADSSHTAPVNAGSYTAMINIPKAGREGSLNIGAPEKCQYVEFTIAKAEQTIETGADVTMTIGDSGKTVTASVTKGDGALSYTVSPSTGLTVDANGALTATAAGEYTITAKAAGTANYNAAICADTIKVTVNKKTQTITVPNENITVTYGSPVSIGASANDGAVISYVSNATDYFTVDSTGKVTFVKADSTGTKTVTVKAAATDIYAAAEKTVYVKTAKAALTLGFDSSDPNNAYAGETVAQVLARINGKVTGLVNNDTQDAVGTMTKYIQNGSGAKLDATQELLADGSKNSYVLEFALNSAKAECYTVDPEKLVRTTAITVSKRDRTVTPAKETVYVKVGGSGSVSATASETPITGVTALASGKLGTVTYALKESSSIVTAVDAATGALTLSGDEGSAVVVATAAENDYYNAATAEITVVVSNKLSPEPSVGYWETVYMGETDRPVSVETKSDGAVTISISDGSSISLTPAADGKSADVTTLTPGTTKVHVNIAETADYAGFDHDYEIEVKKRDQTVKASDITLYAGENKSVGATVAEKPVKFVTALSGKTGELSYKVTDGTAVTVNAKTGKLTFVEDGTATVTVTAKENDIYNAGTKTITVTAHKRDQVINAGNVTMYTGESKSVGATVAEKPVKFVTALSGKTGELSYKVTDGTAVTVNAKTGKLTFVEDGTATVTVTAAANDIYNAATKDVTVTAHKRDQVINAGSVTMYAGESKSVGATAEENAVNGVPALLNKTGALSYEVKSGDAVTVDPATGKLTFVKAGKATVTVTAEANDIYNKQTKDITVTVKKRAQEVKADDMTIAETDSGLKLEPTVSEVAKSGVPALMGKTTKPVYESSDESVATVDEDGVITAKKPGKVTITMILPENEYYGATSVPAKMTLTVEPLEVIEGKGGKYLVGSKEGLTFRANGVYDRFVGVQVDGKDVDKSNYTAWSGSTYVQFTTKYLDSLTTGKHKLTYIYTNGKCSCEFYVERKSSGSQKGNPETGDSENIVLWTNLLLVSVLTVVFIVLDRKKKGVSLLK